MDDIFDINLPYDNNHKKEWDDFIKSLDVQTACRLCGIDHFPCWLAAAANWQLLIEYLSCKFPADTPVKEALVLAIKEQRDDPDSEHSEWWLRIKHVVPDLEKFAYLNLTGQIKPMSEIMMEDFKND